MWSIRSEILCVFSRAAVLMVLLAMNAIACELALGRFMRGVAASSFGPRSRAHVLLWTCKEVVFRHTLRPVVTGQKNEGTLAATNVAQHNLQVRGRASAVLSRLFLKPFAMVLVLLAEVFHQCSAWQLVTDLWCLCVFSLVRTLAGT